MELDPSSYRRAQEVFDVAVAMTVLRQREFVEQSCKDDPTLAKFVLELLDRDRRSDVLALSTQVSNHMAERSEIDDLIGRRIGNYQVERRLGVGGMGAVYEAVQETLHRRVALKVLRQGPVSHDATRRFEFEVEVLGRLHHPAIAQIYEAGTLNLGAGPVPFFAMEIVLGALPITKYAEHRGLDTRERVALFVPVCDALQHGHQKGVVHRDLKPGNVLVDQHGHPKVIDFGVARAIDSDIALTTMHTHTGQLIGTLAYMSPEQCEADPRAIDVRSDVYSLGVLLYELLCGVLPYDIATLSIPAAATVIRAKPPVRPSQHLKSLRGPLEAILLKALAKDRDRRYESTAMFASDLRSYLARRSISARPPTRWTQMIGWMAGHPVLSTALACVGVVLLTVSSMWAGVLLISNDPIRVDLAGGKAVLKSRVGGILHEWPEGATGTVSRAQLVDRPPEFGGGRLALIGSYNSPRAHEPFGVVDAFDVDSPSERVWSTASTPLVSPPGKPHGPEARFGLTTMLVADTLESVPGEEVVVVQRLHPFSPTALRVFDLAGRLRYEAWHDGAVYSALWLAKARQLVVAAVEGQHMWSERGVDLGSEADNYPKAVFALTIVDGHHDHPTWIVRDGRVMDSTVAWFHWFGPTAHLGELGEMQLAIWEATGPRVDSQYTGLRISATPAGEAQFAAAMHFLLDVEGQEVGRVIYDDYRRWQARGIVPSDSEFRWIDYAELPPVAVRFSDDGSDLNSEPSGEASPSRVPR